METMLQHVAEGIVLGALKAPLILALIRIAGEMGTFEMFGFKRPNLTQSLLLTAILVVLP